MMASATERSGVVKDEKTGELYIPASQRPDGSWRKPRKVKDGYIPQEEVPTYENKGVQWLKSIPSLPPGLNPAELESSKSQNEESKPMSKSAKKNAKRKEKKKQQAQEQSSDVQSVTKSLEQTKISDHQSDKKPCQEEAGASDRASIEKKIRNLKKKLRQIQDLQAKLDSGELQELQKEQKEKLSKRKELEDELEDLELDLASMD